MGQRVWLLTYSIASSIYRVFIGIMIVVVVYDKVPIVGVLMAIGGVVTWAGVPMFQLVKYLASIRSFIASESGRSPSASRSRRSPPCWSFRFVFPFTLSSPAWFSRMIP